MNLNLYLNPLVSPNRGLVQNEATLRPVAMPDIVLGDTLALQVYVCDGDGDFDAASGATGYSLRVAIGELGGAPTGGTFTLTYSGATTSALAWNATAAQVETALKALAGIGAGNVSVTGTAPVFEVEFIGTLVFANMPAMTGSAASLTPLSAVVVATSQDGDDSNNEKKLIRLLLLPHTEQTSWTQITDGWSGTLPINTAGLAGAVGSADSASLTLEVELTDPTGYRHTLAQVPVMVWNEIIAHAAADYPPMDSIEGGIICGTADPTTAPPRGTGLYYRTDTGGVWIWNTATLAWDSIIA